VLDQNALKIIWRYATEEILRRSQSADREALTKDQLLKFLWPDYLQLVNEVMVQKEKEIKAEAQGDSA
jgi:hypothetical protein